MREIRRFRFGDKVEFEAHGTMIQGIVVGVDERNRLCIEKDAQNYYWREGNALRPVAPKVRRWRCVDWPEGGSHTIGKIYPEIFDNTIADDYGNKTTNVSSGPRYFIEVTDDCVNGTPKSEPQKQLSPLQEPQPYDMDAAFVAD